MNNKDELLKIFSIKLRTILSKLNLNYDLLQEIRLRVNAPLLVIYDNREYFITAEAELALAETIPYIITKNEIRETMEYISNYSLYAFEEELKQGFITITGGHRIGIAGKAVLEENRVKSMKHISFINIRLSHQVKGCADKVLPYITDEQEECYHTLIVSPPRCGKTTMLRDVIRQLSDGTKNRKGIPVGVVDERSEIGACYMGIPQNDLGMRTDVLDCCPKAKGMLMLIRSMSPRVIAVDEVGSVEDIEAIEYVMNCGCKLIATVHGNSLEDIISKPILGKLVKEKLFERYILLDNHGEVGHLKEIFDEKGVKIY
ncbi:stage III sporulation protein AA [Anaerocolumna cellulosilytica]|uniref:Stage III sporulation protein AA n=1 Tax=Anaerocolumna cellulosilytica TaxID=433286 RepID=A0A6S6R8U2_9FIRM|nr:stage III sporulation protein AA [Anaerocolumna cellulosilytica]MBB5196622.1 stage III sporulation protein AA [Anaerocolumna cellulosilytica]BCJ95722.1 stage III sporulation protein AA [Anaerocolumna cellulosilytica]